MHCRGRPSCSDLSMNTFYFILKNKQTNKQTTQVFVVLVLHTVVADLPAQTCQLTLFILSFKNKTKQKLRSLLHLCYALSWQSFQPRLVNEHFLKMIFNSLKIHTHSGLWCTCVTHCRCRPSCSKNTSSFLSLKKKKKKKKKKTQDFVVLVLGISNVN